MSTMQNMYSFHLKTLISNIRISLYAMTSHFKEATSLLLMKIHKILVVLCQTMEKKDVSGCSDYGKADKQCRRLFKYFYITVVPLHGISFFN